MPAVSASQRRLFGLAEHHPEELYGKNKGLANLPHQTLHDFASTSEKHLPQYKADGMTNTAWQQSEPVRGGKKRPDWMERAVPHMADGKKPGQLPMKPGAPTGAYRVKKTVVDAVTPPPPPARKYFGTPAPMMAGGKKPEKWASEAFKNAGKPGHSLHATLGIPKDEKIPAKRLNAALHSPNKHTRSMAQAAKNI